MAGRNPHIWIAGIVTTGGVTLTHSPVYSNAINTNQELNKLDFTINLPNKYKEITPKSHFKYHLISEKNISTSTAPPNELRLRADRQSYNPSKKVYVAEGNASAYLNGAILRADRIEFDSSFSSLYARGKVRFKKGSQYFQASTLRYSLLKKNGKLQDVYGVIDLEYLGNDLKLISTDDQYYKDQLRKKDRDKLTKIRSLNNEIKKNIPNKIINQFSSQNDLIPIKKHFLDLNKSGTEIACPPILPNPEDHNPYQWGFTSWGGFMTEAMIGDSFLFNGNARNEYLFGFGINKRIYRTGPISIELEGSFFRHNARKEAGGKFNQSIEYAETQPKKFSEGILGIGARLWVKPWLNFGIIEGFSYLTSKSDYERTNRERSSQLLNYLGFEIETLISDNLSLIGRIHHRSGVAGLYNGVKAGSNGYLLGFKYRWGKETKKKDNNHLRPPAGCIDLNGSIRNLPKPIDENLGVVGIDNDLTTFNNKNLNSKVFLYKSEAELSQTILSKLSITEQNDLRQQLIYLTDQRINSIKFDGNISVNAKFGIPDSYRDIDKTSNTGRAKIPQIDNVSKAKFITGTVKKWRIQAGNILINPTGWSSDLVSFTNDPFTPTQARIDSKDVVAKELENGDILVTSSKSRLVLEEKIRLPIVNNRRIRKNDYVQNRWVFGVDMKDRDGLFIGREFKPIQLSENYKLTLQPQFLIQRTIEDSTSSYIEPGSSVTSSKVTQYPDLSDLFGLKTKLRGKTFGWDVSLDTNVSTFNPKNFINGSRYWSSVKRSFNAPLINNFDATFFGAYRYKTWNGSLGQRDIYTAYGGLLEKNGVWNIDAIENEYSLRVGVGNYQSELLKTSSLEELLRINLFSSLKSEFPIWTAKYQRSDSIKNYKYSPYPIVPGIKFNTELSSSYFLYEDGNRQSTISLGAGPTFTIGSFTRDYFDYTNLSLSIATTYKQGKSPFAFDEAIDLLTFGFGLDQQLIGPLVLTTGFEFNIDRGSKYYGEAINSQIALAWKRRAYQFGIFYNPSKGIGGLNFRLNDFSFGGTGVPFIPPTKNN